MLSSDSLVPFVIGKWCRDVREQVRIGAFAILVFGVILTVASLFADPLALGTPGSGFGWKQMLGTALGVLFAAGGFWLVRRLESE